MPGKIQELKIGPFSGGINTFSDRSAIADNELVDCINFEIDLDGSLKSRPPWGLLYSNSTAVGTGSTTQNQIILGTYVIDGNRMVIFQTIPDSSTNKAEIYWVDGPQAGTIQPLTTMGATGFFSTSVRYEDIIYLIPAPGSTYGCWKYDTSTLAGVQITTMPAGNAAVIYKDSLYIGGGNSTNKSRIAFSALADFTSWPSSNFFDISPGDGDTLQDFLIYQDNILIAKDNNTYVLSYDTTPAQAVVRNISTSIGVKGPYCMQTYENSVYFLQYSTVYEMINYDFTRISIKVPFELDETIVLESPTSVIETGGWKYPVFLSVVGDRLVARFYNRIYVYHLRVRSWTRWVSADLNIQNIGPIFELDRTNSSEVQGWRSYVACMALGNVVDYNPQSDGFLLSKIFIFKDTYDDISTENGSVNQVANPDVTIECTALTKVYDVGLSHRFKRLMHWGADVVTANDVSGTLYPLSMVYRTKWSQLNGMTWADLLTWGYPLFDVPDITQTASISNRVDRRFIRFPKSLRFRLLQFKIEIPTQGNTLDGPARLYTLTAFIGAKQLVSEAVN